MLGIAIFLHQLFGNLLWVKCGLMYGGEYIMDKACPRGVYRYLVSAQTQSWGLAVTG